MWNPHILLTALWETVWHYLDLSEYVCKPSPSNPTLNIY